MEGEVRWTRRLPRRNFVSVPELAAARGVSRVAIHYAIRIGKLRAYRVEGKREWYVHVKDASVYLKGKRRRKFFFGEEVAT